MNEQKLVYETLEDRGYKLKAFYIEDDLLIARVELWKDNNVIRSIYTPAYKVWNYSAHLHDIVDAEIYEC